MFFLANIASGGFENIIEIDTKMPVEAIDITSNVQKAIEESKVENGISLIYTLHTTTGITVNEAEPGLIHDILSLMNSLAPKGAGYRHDRSDGNAHAHLQAVLLGSSAVVPVERGKLVLGTWQKVLFMELDGPRRRRIHVKVISE